MTPPVVRILEAAATAMLVPGAWTRGAIARTSRNGLVVPASNPGAVCFCAQGAIEAATMALYPQRPSLAINARAELCQQIGRTPVPTWNDARGRTAEQVAEAMWKAAQNAKRQSS